MYANETHKFDISYSLFSVKSKLIHDQNLEQNIAHTFVHTVCSMCIIIVVNAIEQ